MNAKGPVFKYGDNIDTDVIIPARYLNTQSPAELASFTKQFPMGGFGVLFHVGS